MSKQKLIAGPVEGYKIVNDDLTCRDFKFDITPGVINDLQNDRNLELCGNGFHFCKQPSGVWAYYGYGRVFKIKAYDVLDLPEAPGADHKLVCRRIEFVEEVIVGGNTGDYNTGGFNIGDHNTGDRNTGDRNTGNYNTGYYNTGGFNTGGRNTGDHNTGDHNTGDYNTGGFNIGDHNTGNGNVGNKHSGSLCHGEAPVYLFNKLVPNWAVVNTSLIAKLCKLLQEDAPIDPTPFLSLPNASRKAIKDLHNASIKARKELKNASK